MGISGSKRRGSLARLGWGANVTCCLTQKLCWFFFCSFCHLKSAIGIGTRSVFAASPVVRSESYRANTWARSLPGTPADKPLPHYKSACLVRSFWERSRQQPERKGDVNICILVCQWSKHVQPTKARAMACSYAAGLYYAYKWDEIWQINETK